MNPTKEYMQKLRQRGKAFRRLLGDVHNEIVVPAGNRGAFFLSATFVGAPADPAARNANIFLEAARITSTQSVGMYFQVAALPAGTVGVSDHNNPDTGDPDPVNGLFVDLRKDAADQAIPMETGHGLVCEAGIPLELEPELSGRSHNCIAIWFENSTAADATIRLSGEVYIWATS